MTHSPAPTAASPADFKVGVDTTIFSIDTLQNRLLILLVRRREDPFVGQWSLPGTLVRQTESLEEAARRILSEKIRVDQLYLEQLYTFGGPFRDPREAPESYGVRYLSVSYFALVRFQDAQLLADGVEGIAWYPVAEIPPLAFDHDQICDYAHRRLSNKLAYSPIAFDILPETFTLGEIYQLYCTVLGEQFSDYSNFRARLLKLGILKDTGQKTTQGAGRPAALYRFNSEAFERIKHKPMVFV